MTTRTITTCDRCEADLTDTDYFQVGQRPAGIQGLTTDTLDLCGGCKKAFDRFMKPTWTVGDAERRAAK